MSADSTLRRRERDARLGGQEAVERLLAAERRVGALTETGQLTALSWYLSEMFCRNKLKRTREAYPFGRAGYYLLKGRSDLADSALGHAWPFRQAGYGPQGLSPWGLTARFPDGPRDYRWLVARVLRNYVESGKKNGKTYKSLFLTLDRPDTSDKPADRSHGEVWRLLARLGKARGWLSLTWEPLAELNLLRSGAISPEGLPRALRGATSPGLPALGRVGDL